MAICSSICGSILHELRIRTSDAGACASYSFDSLRLDCRLRERRQEECANGRVQLHFQIIWQMAPQISTVCTISTVG